MFVGYAICHDHSVDLFNLNGFPLQLISWGFIALGTWAYLETENYQVQEVESILDIIFNVSLVFIIIGILIFLLAFMGALGALRENTCLLKTVSIIMHFIQCFKSEDLWGQSPNCTPGMWLHAIHI